MSNRENGERGFPLQQPVRLGELALKNREHLAWRLDAKTGCGMLTACRIARLETGMNDWPIFEIFKWAGKSTHSAKIHAAKVIKFAA